MIYNFSERINRLNSIIDEISVNFSNKLKRVGIAEFKEIIGPMDKSKRDGNDRFGYKSDNLIQYISSALHYKELNNVVTIEYKTILSNLNSIHNNLTKTSKYLSEATKYNLNGFHMNIAYTKNREVYLIRVYNGWIIVFIKGSFIKNILWKSITDDQIVYYLILGYITIDIDRYFNKQFKMKIISKEGNIELV